MRVIVDGEPTEEWLAMEARLLHKNELSFPRISFVEDTVFNPGLEVTSR